MQNVIHVIKVPYHGYSMHRKFGGLDERFLRYAGVYRQTHTLITILRTATKAEYNKYRMK